jgi:hypothetical protein
MRIHNSPLHCTGESKETRFLTMKKISQLNVWLAFIVLATSLILAESVNACLCANLPVKKKVRLMKQKADAIFTGTAKLINGYGEIDGGRVKAVLVVEKLWKGAKVDEYTIYTNGGCSAFFEVGKEYLIYAQKDEKGELTTDICMGTGDIRAAKKDLKYLGRPAVARKASPGSRRQQRRKSFRQQRG